MVDVESGSFYMGAQKESSSKENYDENAYMVESPVHCVTLNDYAIGKFEVTQGQWMAAMGSNPSSIQGDDLPVENVTWEQVQEFIALLNEKSGKNTDYPPKPNGNMLQKEETNQRVINIAAFLFLVLVGGIIQIVNHLLTKLELNIRMNLAYMT